MRLLILTQKVDAQDPILGFFHGWLKEFSKSFEFLTVICLQKGESDLAKNTKVLSLGKEKKQSRFKYVFNFYKYIWQERNNYDVVFVHMNQEYVLLGAIIWKFLGKKIFLWRNHPNGNLFTRLAVIMADRVFCTSQYSYTAKFQKTKIMPVGIDTTIFKKNDLVVKKPNSILFFGRISPVKKVEIFIKACQLLKERGLDFSADIVGDPTPSDYQYYSGLLKLIKDLELERFVNFKPSILNTQAPDLYNQYEIYVNTTPTGSFDKTIMEALACETLVVSSNSTLRNFLNAPYFFTENNSSELSERLLEILNWPKIKKINEAVAGRLMVKETHDLRLLMNEIKKSID